MDNIYSITILDFNEKIFFLHKRPDFPFESALNLSRNIIKSIKANYLQDYIKKQYEFRLMDTIMTSKIKVKVSLLWEVCVIILYSSMIDLHLINLYNQRMIEALYMLCKTKKLKMDYLSKRYQDVNKVLEDTIFYLSPKLRIGNKTELTFTGTDIQEHCVYFQKFNRAMQTLKTQAYYHSTKDFLKAKGEISYHRNQNEKLNKTKFIINSFMNEAFTVSKNNMISGFVSSDKLKKKEAHELDHQLKKKKNDNSNIGRKKDKSTISSTESNKLDTPSISPEVNIQKIQTIPYKSNSVIFADSDEKQKTHHDNNGKEDKTRNAEKSLKSLKSMDINCVLSRINFEDNTNHITKQPDTQNKNKNNGFNDMFSDDFFNFISANNQQVVQFTDFTVQNNENSGNNTLNSSQSLYNKQPTNNKKSIVITQMFDKKKSQSPDILHNQQQNISDMKKSEGPIINLNFVNQNTKERDNETQLSDKFNINHIDNKPIQSIDLTTLNLIGVKEDVFDLNEIKRQLRCSIIEKGTLINTKGAYSDINYRGQLSLELTTNFVIHNKTFFLKVKHPNWTDQNCFNKTLSKSIMSEEGQDSYKFNCREVKSMQRILEYSPNLKIIQPGAEFKVTGAFKEEKYKLEFICQMNEDDHKNMRASQMIITIITKSNDIVINKTNNSNYKIEDKKMTYMFKDFHTNLKHFLGIIFKTEDPTFVQIVKVNYRYMDILPSSLNAEISYIDDQGVRRILDVAKKCMVEISFTP